MDFLRQKIKGEETVPNGNIDSVGLSFVFSVKGIYGSHLRLEDLRLGSEKSEEKTLTDGDKESIVLSEMILGSSDNIDLLFILAYEFFESCLYTRSPSPLPCCFSQSSFKEARR